MHQFNSNLRNLNIKSYTLSRLPFLLPSVSHAQETEATRLQEMINHARQLRALMQSDPHRPIYHFVAPEGHAVPFDPNGALYWKGKYHLGYVYPKFIDGKEQLV